MSPIPIVTVTFDSGDVIEAFLDSIDAATAAPTEVIIVDNGSQDLDTLVRVATKHGARLITSTENRGYGAGISAGIAAIQATSEFVVVANPDVVFGRGSIDQLVATARARPRAGAVGPAITGLDGAIYPSARALPTLTTGIGHATLSGVWPGNPWSARYRDPEPLDAPREAGWLSGSCLLLRRESYAEVGGFDDSYFMYFEDVDLGDRLGSHGWANVYEPRAVVVHSGAHSTTRHSRRMVRAHHESAYRYLSRKYRRWYHLPMLAVVRVGLAVRAWWVTR